MPADSSQADAILIFGGDGTVHRHLPDLVRLKLPVLVVPCGSGNDFARALGLGSVSHAVAAWKKFLAGSGNVQEIDLGLISEPSSRESYYFACIAGIGLDGEVARRANKFPRWLRANGGYALCLPQALSNFTPPHAELLASHPEQPGEFVPKFSQPIMLAAFANTPVYGGGMRIAPKADFTDGMLDVCIVGNMSKTRLLRLFPSVYSGKHLSLVGVEYFQAERLRVSTNEPIDVYADGEYVCKTPIEVSVESRVLRVIV